MVAWACVVSGWATMVVFLWLYVIIMRGVCFSDVRFSGAVYRSLILFDLDSTIVQPSGPVFDVSFLSTFVVQVFWAFSAATQRSLILRSPGCLVHVTLPKDDPEVKDSSLGARALEWIFFGNDPNSPLVHVYIPRLNHIVSANEVKIFPDYWPFLEPCMYDITDFTTSNLVNLRVPLRPLATCKRERIAQIQKVNLTPNVSPPIVVTTDDQTQNDDNHTPPCNHTWAIHTPCKRPRSYWLRQYSSTLTSFPTRPLLGEKNRQLPHAVCIGPVTPVSSTRFQTTYELQL